QVELFERRPEVGVVATAADLLLDGERTPGPRIAFGQSELVRENAITSSSAMVRRDLLETYGAFDPDRGLWGSIDYELWLRLLPHTEFAYVPEPLVLYRVHERQMSA